MRYLSFLFLVVLFNSCSNNDSTETESEEDYSSFISAQKITEEIEFMPFETYADHNAIAAPMLTLRIKTVEQFPCINFGIETTQFQNGNELIIRFEQILEYDLCATAIGPATTSIQLPEDITKLTFLNGNNIDQYDVEINQEVVEMTTITANFTTSLHENTFRYPENSFAVVCGTNTNNSHIYDDLLQMLRQNPAFTEFSFGTSGRIPYPEASSGHWQNHPSHFFNYDSIASLAALENQIDQFVAQNVTSGSGVSVSIYSWDNRRF